jgi:hypothetical protein
MANALRRAYDEFRRTKGLPDSPYALKDYIVEIRAYGAEYEVRFVPSFKGTTEGWKVANESASEIFEILHGGVSAPVVIPGIVVSELRTLTVYAMKTDSVFSQGWLSAGAYRLELGIGGGALSATFIQTAQLATPRPSPALRCISGCSGGETFLLLLSGSTFTVRRVGAI